MTSMMVRAGWPARKMGKELPLFEAGGAALSTSGGVGLAVGDLEPPAGRSATSQAAAERIKRHVRGQRSAILEFIGRCGDWGAIDEEIQRDRDLKVQSETPRRGELVKRGLVADSGRTRLTSSGRRAAVWILTEAGRRAVEGNR